MHIPSSSSSLLTVILFTTPIFSYTYNSVNSLPLPSTSYRFNPLEHLAGVAPPLNPLDPPLDPSPPQGCNITRAAYLIRHAAIFANDFDYETYISPFTSKLSNTTQIWSSIPLLSFLSTWTSPISSAEQEMLTRTGKLEALKLGVDVSQRYMGLKIPNKIWSSTAERTVVSAESFAEGISNGGNVSVVQVSEGSEEGADSLTPYESCPNYSGSAGSNQSMIYQNIYTLPILTQFNALAPSFDFTPNDIYAMSLLCGYETLIRGSSPFCSLSLLPPNTWLGFEYTNDLMYHYNTGYGSPYSGAIGFPWVNATFNTLLSSSQDNTTGSSQDLYVSFTHRELPPTVLVAMGLFNNSAYSGANNINDTMPNSTINFGRAWKSSNILPFLANIAVERMECNSFGYNGTGTYLRVLVNGSPQPLEGCRDGPGFSCEEANIGDWLQERVSVVGEYGSTCGVDLGNSTDVLGIYGS